MKIALLIFGSFLALVILAVGVFMFSMRFSDGPKGPIPGGELLSGELVDATHIQWDEVLGDQPVAEVELQLENPVSSRTTGAFVHNGKLYVPCDLGYVWRRLPDGPARLMLHTIWFFKDWHEKATIDGRVVIRIEGKRYKLNAVRVAEEELISKFRERVSTAAGEVFELLPVKTDPNDIWFFHLDARSENTG